MAKLSLTLVEYEERDPKKAVDITTEYCEYIDQDKHKIPNQKSWYLYSGIIDDH